MNITIRLLVAFVLLLGPFMGQGQGVSCNGEKSNGNGICDTDDAAHCGPGTHWDVVLGLCVISCPADLNLDGAVAIGDLLDLLSQFATYCPNLD